MPYGLFDYIPDSPIHTMGLRGIPNPPSSGLGTGTLNPSCPRTIMENGFQYQINPPATITRGKCEYVLGAATPVLPQPSRCPQGQDYYEGISSPRGVMQRGCYTRAEYEAMYNEIFGKEIFPIRTPPSLMPEYGGIVR